MLIKTPSRATTFDQFIGIIVRAAGDMNAARMFARDAVALGADPQLMQAIETIPDPKGLTDHIGPQAMAARKQLFLQQKAAVAAGTTANSTWAGALVALHSLMTDWFASLRNTGALDALAEYARPMPTGLHFALTSATGAGHNVDETAWVPLTSFGFDAGTSTPTKALSLVVVPNDLLLFGGQLANAMIASELKAAASKAADSVVVSKLTTGLTPITSTGDPRHDLRKLVAAVEMGQDSRPMFLTGVNAAKQLALFGTADGPMLFPDLQLPSGGTIAGVPMLALDVLTNTGSPSTDSVILCDANQVGIDPGVIELDASKNCTLQMVDNPSGAANMVSMFQTSSTALRATRWFSLTRIRESAVAIVEGANYEP
jgi:hypothetical protein